jgi:Diadenosine tetraphosphate (Ap4A) hydrolase and other HIT family hydrolases
MTQSCVLCSGLLAGRSSELWDSIIAETPEFVVVPTKGALVPGWLLVVSKKHFLCAGALEPEQGVQEAVGAIDVARNLVEATFGPVTIFEHGPVAAGMGLGCGIDHLHFHVAPLQISLKAAVARLYPKTTWRSIAGWSELGAIYSTGNSYIAVQEPGDSLYWSPPPFGVRQPLRRAIASAIGAADRFDYSAHPHAENVATTIRVLARA